MSIELLCPKCKCDTFIRVSKVKVKVFDDGNTITDEYVGSDEYTYKCSNCGVELSDRELVKGFIKYDFNSVREEIREQQRQDILDRYDNEEYWDFEIEDQIKENEFIYDDRLNKEVFKEGNLIEVDLLKWIIKDDEDWELREDSSKESGFLLYYCDKIVLELIKKEVDNKEYFLITYKL